MTLLVTLVIAAVCVVLGLALAYVPLRLIVAHIARNVKQLIDRQRERRTQTRDTPDRRGEAPRP